MSNKNGVVGLREYFAIIVLIIGVKLADSTPSLFYDSLKSASWMAPLIEGIISIIPVYFLIKVFSLYETKNLYDVNIHLFGKFLGTTLSFIFWIYGSMVITVDARSYVDIIGTIYFTKTPTIAIFIVLFMACSYTAKKGIQHLGSLSWMVLFYIKIILLFALLLTLQKGHMFTIFPLWGPGIKEVFVESTFKTSIYGDFFFMTIVYPFFASKKVYSKGSWIALLFLTFEMTTAFLLFIFLFDYEPASFLTYPFHEMVRYISIGHFITSIDTLFFPFWILASLIRFSVYLYLSAMLFGSVFKIKDFEYAIPIIASVCLIFGMLPETPSFIIYHLRDPLYQMFSPVFIFFPVLLWFIAKLRGDFKNESVKNNF